MHRFVRAFALLALSAGISLFWRSAAADVQRLDVPAAAGSQGPNLVSADGRVVLSWLEPFEGGQRLRFSVLEGDAWSEPRAVASGSDWLVNWADFPSVAPIDGSLWASHWLVNQPGSFHAYDIRVALSRDSGATWSDPVMPHDDGTASEHGFVTLFPQAGGVGLIWLDGRNYANEPVEDPAAAGMTLRAASYTTESKKVLDTELDGLVCDCCQTDAVVAGDNVLAVYRNRTTAETRDIYIARRLDDGWSAGTAVADDGWEIGGCPVNGPAIAADNGRVAVAWFTGAKDRARVRVAASRDGGETFSAPVDTADGNTYGHAGVALLPDDRIAVSSLCKSATNQAQLCLRVLGPDNELGPVLPVSGPDTVPALSVPQLAADGERLIAAWIAVSDGTSSIRSASIRTGGPDD